MLYHQVGPTPFVYSREPIRALLLQGYHQKSVGRLMQAMYGVEFWRFLRDLGIWELRHKDLKAAGQPLCASIIPPHRREEVVRLMQLGWGSVRVAREVGVSPSTIQKYYKEAVGPLPPMERPLSFEDAHALWLRGMLQIDIAKALGVSQTRISRCLHRHGIRGHYKAGEIRHSQPILPPLERRDYSPAEMLSLSKLGYLQAEIAVAGGTDQPAVGRILQGVRGENVRQTVGP